MSQSSASHMSYDIRLTMQHLNLTSFLFLFHFCKTQIQNRPTQAISCFACETSFSFSPLTLDAQRKCNSSWFLSQSPNLNIHAYRNNEPILSKIITYASFFS